jgi:hypothetical protein
MLYFENVTFKSSRRDIPIKIDINDDGFRTPKTLRDLTGAPYLISINDYAHFERVIANLSNKIGDRTLAGYALSELNVSCKFKERQNKLSDCFQYKY